MSPERVYQLIYLNFNLTSVISDTLRILEYHLRVTSGHDDYAARLIPHGANVAVVGSLTSAGDQIKK
jgi:hypothetical protein